MDGWLLPSLLMIALFAATYFSAMSLALLDVSRSELRRRLEAVGKAESARWLFNRLDPTVLAVALLRTVARVSVMVLVLASMIGLEGPAVITWGRLLAAGGVAAALLWVFTSVVAGAMARHASVGLISTALPVLRVIHVALLPITRLVGFIDEAVRRLSGAERPAHDPAGEELLRSIEDTQQEGGLDEVAAEMLENVVEFRTIEVGEIMTPRTDIEGIELTDDLGAIREFIAVARHSRIPVYRESLDQIVGILYVKDLIPWLGREPADFHLQPLLRRPILVPETKRVRDMLQEFRASEVHLAIVIDEYGGTAGLVTIEDVLEQIVGDIRDEHEPPHEEEPTLTVINENRVEVDGRFYVDELNERLDLRIPESDDYDTVAGFVLAKLGRVPAAGETLEAEGATFTVLAASPTHVKRVVIDLPEPITRPVEVGQPAK
jgi:putative hemolysin